MKPHYYDRWRIRNDSYIWAEFANRDEALAYFARSAPEGPCGKLRLVHITPKWRKKLIAQERQDIEVHKEIMREREVRPVLEREGKA